jgi:hypothetical protein
MCFMLHIATDRPVPRRAWDEADRHVWIGDVDEHAEPVGERFSLPNIAYVGSDLNCGCGFRHLIFENGHLPEEWLIADGGISTAGTGKNHQELHSVLVDVLQFSATAELYGCHADDCGEKTEGEREIQADEVLSEQFFFRERVLYRVIRAAYNGMQAGP